MQKTIAKPAEISGIGVNSGEFATVVLKPALPNTGIVFVRTDLPGTPSIPANSDFMGNRARRTALVNEGVEIQMVEHLMASFAGLRIDNLIVELDGNELPVGDGSALPFVEAILNAGMEDQDEPKKELKLAAPIAVNDDTGFLVAAPSENGLSVSYTLNLPLESFAVQHCDMAIDEETFIKEIAPARTFVLESMTEQLRARGLGKGANHQNLLVVNENGVVDNELRFPDEFARHKVLDLLGDLYLVGCSVQAQLVAVRSGHPLNTQLVQHIRRTMLEKETGKTALSMSIQQIQEVLPHRYPFLLIDRVIELIPGERARGIKNLTFNEHFFQGHWPGQPVMPGVLQIEAMAQLGGMLMLEKCRGLDKRAMIFAIDSVKLRRAVIPGDQLVIEVEAMRTKGRVWQVYARSSVDGQLASEAEIKFILVDPT